jgi:hypothetical protein
VPPGTPGAHRVIPAQAGIHVLDSPQVVIPAQAGISPPATVPLPVSPSPPSAGFFMRDN